MDDLDHAIFSSVDAEDEALLKAAQGDDHTFSDAYQRKMDLLYRNGRGAKRPVRWKKRLLATIVAAALLVSTVTAGAFWKEISVFFESLYSQYTDLAAVRQPAPSMPILDKSLDNWDSYWYPFYLPSGFCFQSAHERSRVRSIVFEAEANGRLYFEQMPAAFVVGNDTEGTPVDGISVGDFETFAFKKEIDGSVTRILIWSDGNTSFRLTGFISFDELVGVAEQIIYIESEAH